MTRRDQIEQRVAALTLGIHRRNGGKLSVLLPEQKLLDPSLGLDSLDLAEVMAALEREFGVSPFEQAAPRTWGEIIDAIQRGYSERRG
jgi:acyl carrier protein